MQTSGNPLPEEPSPSFLHNFSHLLLNIEAYAIFIIDPQGIVQSWNHGAEHIYGYSAAEMIGKNYSAFFSGDQIHKSELFLQLQSSTHRNHIENEVWMYKKSGERFFASTNITAVRKGQTLVGFVAVTRDVTRQKNLEDENRLLYQLQEELVRQRTVELSTVNKELEAFSYSVSHDLRTPLRAISGYSMMLQEDYENQLDEEGKRIIKVILDNTQKMGALIDDLLAFSKLSRLEVIQESVHMKRLAETCVAELLTGEKAGAYTIVIADLPNCKGDPSMLKQVWMNLIGNAVKYASKTIHPLIEIGFLSEDKTNTYYIKDNGVGFDMKYYSKLFGVFQRLHRAEEFEGTGLGLALVKRIISKHLGQVWGEATLGSGAVFYFSIPKGLKNEYTN